MNVFIIFIVVMISLVFAYVKTYQIVIFKYVKLIICQLYLNKAIKKVSSLAPTLPKCITR